MKFNLLCILRYGLSCGGLKVVTDLDKSVDFSKYKSLEYYGYGPGYGWRGGYSTTNVTEYNYVAGTLMVSVYDAENKQLIWESGGEKTVDENPKNAEAKIAKVAEKMMYDYPYRGSPWYG